MNKKILRLSKIHIKRKARRILWFISLATPTAIYRGLKKSKAKKSLAKKDILIICGDFGFLWNPKKRSRKEKFGNS
ncbi:MAG: hypothetical protein L6V88_01725 [Anaerotruncus sp.]|nr:MAG: hypothetical protein L6V88_01725 [Anaerotruncus sp.]